MITSAALAASAVGHHSAGPAASAFAQLLLPSIEADDHVDARVAQIQRVRVSLAAVADDGDCLALQMLEVSVFFVIAFCHCMLQ